MSTTSKYLGLALPGQNDYYDVEVFNENSRKIDAAIGRFVDTNTVIDGSVITSTFDDGSKSVTVVNDTDSVILESFYGADDTLKEQHITKIVGNTIEEKAVILDE